MAKGDAVLGYFTAAGSFQPAAGVEVLITAVSTTSANTAVDYSYYAAAGPRGIVCFAPVSPQAQMNKPLMPLTNTQYLYVAGAGSYGGIQIK